MPLVITYTSLILWNTRLLAESGFELENLNVCRTFTGTEDERWFHMICSAMEAEAGPAIQQLVNATNAAAIRSEDTAAVVTSSLLLLQETLKRITLLLQEMHKRVDPTIWFTRLRPYLAGGIDSSLLPKGVSFDNGATYVRLAGANAGQSSLFQFFDAVLSISHNNDFAIKMREYIPGPHVRFLERVEQEACIREFVLRDGDEGLKGVYDACVKELEVFRTKHIQIVSRYIILPARAAARAASLEGQPAVEKQELTGVGGAPLMPFLRGMRDETRESSLATCSKA